MRKYDYLRLTITISATTLSSDLYLKLFGSTIITRLGKNEQISGRCGEQREEADRSYQGDRSVTFTYSHFHE